MTTNDKETTFLWEVVMEVDTSGISVVVTMDPLMVSSATKLISNECHSSQTLLDLSSIWNLGLSLFDHVLMFSSVEQRWSNIRRTVA